MNKIRTARFALTKPMFSYMDIVIIAVIAAIIEEIASYVL